MLKELSREELKKNVPAIFTVQAHEKMSDKYKQYPTSDVLDLMVKNDFVPVYAQQQRANVGVSDFKKHIIRFRHKTQVDALFNRTIEDGVDIVIVNSHDGSSCYNIAIGIFRLVCSNGLIVGKEMFNQTIRHMGSTPQQVLSASMDLIQRAPLIMSQIEKFKAVMLDDKRKVKFAKEAFKLRFEKEWDGTTLAGDWRMRGKSEKTLFNARDILTPRRTIDNSPTLWNVFNTTQENLIKGSDGWIATNNGQRKMRGITNIDASVRINKELWNLAEKYAE